MAISDEVINLRNQGVSDGEIVESFRGRGVSPKEITDAMSQAQIKNAVSGGESEMESSIIDTGIPAENQSAISGDNYSGGAVEESNYVNQPQGISGGVGGPYDSGTSQMNNMAPASEVPQMGMGGDSQMGEEYYQDDYGGYGGGDTDTIIEVAEQVFLEKSKKMKKQISESNEFRVLASSKIEDISNRLKRMESSMDKLQHAILEKVGEYGNGLGAIKKEMGMMQDSFRKVVSEGRR